MRDSGSILSSLYYSYVHQFAQGELLELAVQSTQY
eukprot:COSAG01_NODE_48579_length_379_cov_58.510714_1_plen_34_part_01